MPITVYGHLDGNILDCFDGFLTDYHGSVTFEGTGNRLTIARPDKLDTFVCGLKNGATITIEGSIHAESIHAHALAPDAQIRVRHNTAVNGHLSLGCHETASIVIGAHCLIGPNCDLYASDVHQILDAQTGARLNPADDITLEDHVWLAGNVSIRKGTYIGRDSVVGRASVVSGEYPPGSLLIGTPARVVRSGVTWKY